MATLKKEKEKGSFTEKAMLTSLIQQVFSHCNVGSVNITDRILKMFSAKLWRMKKSKGKAHKGGGKQLKVLYEKMEHSNFLIWKFKVYYSEVDNILAKTENDKLRGEKRKLESKLEKMNEKVARLEEKVEKAEKSTQSYKKKFQKLSQKLIKMQREQTGTRGPDKKKKFCDYSKRHQERIRGQLKTDCENSSTFFLAFMILLRRK